MLSDNNRNEGNAPKGGGRQKAVIIAITIVAVIAVSIVVFLVAGSKGREFKKQMNLGQKYLAEMNYDEAIVSFERALAIDPMSADAYLGMADAYVGKGDYENAIKVLEKGIKVLEGSGEDSSKLTTKLEEITSILEEEKRAEEERKVNERNAELAIQWNDFEGISDRVYGSISAGVDDPGQLGVYVTRDQREEVLRPLIDELEAYIKFVTQEEYSGIDPLLYKTPTIDGFAASAVGGYVMLESAYRYLAYLYIRIDDLENALRVRKEYADYFKLSGYSEGPHYDAEGGYYDEYGRDLSRGQVYDGAYCIETGTEDAGSTRIVCKYDLNGRLESYTFTYFINGNSYNRILEYEGDTVVVITYSDGVEKNREEYKINKYGFIM